MTGPDGKGGRNAVNRLARRLGGKQGDSSVSRRGEHDRPIFLIGCCHRTGSTLLQRLVSSITDVFIWGENHGAGSTLLKSRQQLLSWSDRHAGARDDIRRHGTEAFMANATPERDRIDDAYRAYFRELYRLDVDGMPVERWGFKEVRHNAAELAELLQLFPAGRAIAINRDLGQVAESVLRWEFDPSIEWESAWTVETLNAWRDNTFDLPSLPSELLLRINYGDLVQNTEETLQRIEQFLDVPIGAIDRAVMQVRVHADGERGRSTLRPTFTTIPARVAKFLADEQTTAAMEAFDRYW